MATTEVRSDAPAEPVAPRMRTRDRFLPRTVLGLSALILFTALGAAFSGAVLYTYYQYKLDQNEKKLTTLAGQAASSLNRAKDIIDAEKENARKDIQTELAPLRQLAASEETLSKLADKVGPSVWYVQTADEAGQPSVGSAFVVASDADQSFLVTSLAVVRAATRQPGPEIHLRKGGDDLKATLWTWQDEKDLALLIVDRPNLPKLKWVDSKPAVRRGERVFAVSGLGGQDAAITQGYVAAVSAEGVQHNASVGTHFRGGPLVNSDGSVVAVVSSAYSPLGFDPGPVTFGIPINDTCAKILRCPGGNAGGAGTKGG